jgi:hypothetical protein
MHVQLVCSITVRHMSIQVDRQPQGSTMSCSTDTSQSGHFLSCQSCNLGVIAVEVLPERRVTDRAVIHWWQRLNPSFPFRFTCVRSVCTNTYYC